MPDPEVVILAPGESCGEGCGREAIIAIEGDSRYCGTCLMHLLHVGGIFKDAVEEAGVHLRALAHA